MCILEIIKVVDYIFIFFFQLKQLDKNAFEKVEPRFDNEIGMIIETNWN